MAKPKPFSDEELERYHSYIPEHTQIHRFLATIAARDKRIWGLEKLTTIDADKRASDRRNIDIIAANCKTIAALKAKRTADAERFKGYIDDWGEQKRKFEKRIEELEKIIGNQSGPEDFKHGDLRFHLDRANTTIERLRGVLERLNTEPLTRCRMAEIISQAIGKEKK